MTSEMIDFNFFEDAKPMESELLSSLNLNRGGAHGAYDEHEKDPMTIQVKPKLNNFEADFLIYDEDYTLGEILREQLSKDDRVQFVGCRKDHQLDNHIRLKIKLYRKRVKGLSPEKALVQCLKLAAKKAQEITLALRNSIVDVEPRTLDTERGSGTNETRGEMSASSIPQLFKFDFKPDEFTF